jgi:hypothetical protein
MPFRRITSRDNPATIARKSAEYQVRLERALTIVRARAVRSSSTIKRLLDSASVKGQVLDIKAASVTFSAEPFRGGLHQVWRWGLIDGRSDSELASELSLALRSELKRKLMARDV